MTNSLDVLQKKYQEDEKQIDEAKKKLDLLRKSYKTNDQPYLDAKGNFEQMIEFHKLLAAKIQADKIDAQIPSQGTH